ncbi:MAG: PHP domain-containing protein [Deltaproteobacteria bacterium]|nr:PHP domain-containing protein [Deltaproteobacteria bacterium]
MLKFTRNKVTSVLRKSEDILSVHGVMEDDIYGMEIDIDLVLSNLEIRSIRGIWNRMENSDCPRAIPYLQEAVGYRIDEDVTQKVQKIIGRLACRHFADLILECFDAVRDAIVLLQETAESQGPNMEISDYFGVTDGPDRTEPIEFISIQDRRNRSSSDGVLIDLHVHSHPASPCSSASVEQIIEAAMQSGLDGVCLTDHNYLWDPRDIEDLRQKYGFLILRGNEITTDQGDILVLGLEENIKGIISLTELREKVLKKEGFMIAAHPFRGFLTFGVGYLGLTPKKASERQIFRGVDAIEVLNSRVSEKENKFAAGVGLNLGLPLTGGSDAHKPQEVGLYATRFLDSIRNERDLVACLRKCRFSPVVFRAHLNGNNASK